MHSRRLGSCDGARKRVLVHHILFFASQSSHQSEQAQSCLCCFVNGYNVAYFWQMVRSIVGQLVGLMWSST